MGVLVISGIRFGVCIRAPDFWKLPSELGHLFVFGEFDYVLLG